VFFSIGEKPLKRVEFHLRDAPPDLSGELKCPKPEQCRAKFVQKSGHGASNLRYRISYRPFNHVAARNLSDKCPCRGGGQKNLQQDPDRARIQFGLLG